MSHGTRMLLSVAAAALLLFALFSFSLAQEKSEKSAMAPKAPAEVTDLNWLVGEWRGEFPMTMMGKTMPCKIHHIYKPVAEGFGISLDEEMACQGMPTYIGHSMFGYDQATKLYHIYTIDNYGDVHDHAGKFTDATHLALQCKFIGEGGKEMVEDLVINFDKTNYSFSDLVMSGNDTLQYGAGSMTRVGM